MANWLTYELNNYLKPSDIVLDIGCGIGEISHGLTYEKIVGVDIVDEYLSIYRERVPHSFVLKMDIRTFDYSLFEKDILSRMSFDVVLCVDVIEHLEQGYDKRFLKWMENIATRSVIVFSPEHAETPDKIVLNTPKGMWGTTAGDPFQVHKSYQNRQDYINAGYNFKQYNTCRNTYDNTDYYEMLYWKEFTK